MRGLCSKQIDQNGYRAGKWQMGNLKSTLVILHPIFPQSQFIWREGITHDGGGGLVMIIEVDYLEIDTCQSGEETQIIMDKALEQFGGYWV